MENTENDQQQNKTDEQLASELNLDLAIPNDGLEFEAGAAGSEFNAAGDNNAENALYGIISIAPIGLGMAGLKNTAAVWSDDVCRGISKAMIPVLQKYTFGQRIITFLQTGGGIEEFGLVMALTPVIMASANGYKLDMHEREKEVKEADNEPGNA